MIATVEKCKKSYSGSSVVMCCGYNCKGLPEFTIPPKITSTFVKNYHIKPDTICLSLKWYSQAIGCGVSNYCGDCMNQVMAELKSAVDPKLRILK